MHEKRRACRAVATSQSIAERKIDNKGMTMTEWMKKEKTTQRGKKNKGDTRSPEKVAIETGAGNEE